MKKLGILMAMFFVLAMVVPAWAQPDVSLNPEYAQRNLGGKVRMHIEMTGATDLLSMGVKVTFPADKLQVQTAEKNTDVWVMDDGEGNQYTTPPVEYDNTAGTVTMIGGRLEPGVSGDVLLGWIVFQCSATNTGAADVSVELANPTPYDNFVGEKPAPDVDPPVYDTGMAFTGATICIVPTDACEGDFDNDQDVDMLNMLTFKNAYPSAFPSPNYAPGPDFDADGDVDMLDMLTFKNDYPRGDCPFCSD